ncbi:Uncharacterised protein [Mycolicibacterium vanbaalenii]|uniref:Uncharacterized protein n=1 Tax=Mycolicibacterium vanbaalenii TaxID=110539 RepID=A0A5S9PL34_MYCVN|nr:Uncharacterised protein [Mycolicibacterium vanbaalenii]
MLKYHVLSRPELVAINGAFADNTLPSGHTTAAMPLLFAALIVMSNRFRGVAMFFTHTRAVDSRTPRRPTQRRPSWPALRRPSWPDAAGSAR